jgi:hypothetical protein
LAVPQAKPSEPMHNWHRATEGQEQTTISKNETCLPFGECDPSRQIVFFNGLLE